MIVVVYRYIYLTYKPRCPSPAMSVALPDPRTPTECPSRFWVVAVGPRLPACLSIACVPCLPMGPAQSSVLLIPHRPNECSLTG